MLLKVTQVLPQKKKPRTCSGRSEFVLKGRLRFERTSHNGIVGASGYPKTEPWFGFTAPLTRSRRQRTFQLVPCANQLPTSPAAPMLIGAPRAAGKDRKAGQVPLPSRH
jgi:hypothetical protein